MHHGVAILSKVPIREDHAHDWQDNGEARHVGALLDCGIRIENVRSEEHTSELQSLMRISYAVFCLKKKKRHHDTHKRVSYSQKKGEDKEIRVMIHTE